MSSMTETSDIPSVSQMSHEHLLSLDDMDEAFEIGEAWGVQLDGIKDIDQLKDRLIYHWKRDHGLEEGLSKVERIMTRLCESNNDNNKQLHEISDPIRTILSDVMQDQQLQEYLSTENIPETNERAQKLLVHLMEPKCPILVAGETSSGKSSMVNLFLGDKVLPSHTLSCTATLCEISRGEAWSGQAVMVNGDRVAFSREEMDKYIFKRLNREETFEHHLIELTWPSPILKSGVTLVDTPGVGESNAMKSVLLDYVMQNNVYGFIYVIKSDNAGGVAADRLGYLLQQLVEAKDDRGDQKFDPSTAIFVCNRWDLVDESERNDVKKDTVDKLADYWPDFDPEHQLFFLNATHAYDSFKIGYLTKHYLDVLNGISHVCYLGLKRKTFVVYKSVEEILRRILHPIRTCLRVQHAGAIEMDEILEVNKIIDEMSSKLKSFSKEFTSLVKKSKAAAVEKMKMFISSEEAKQAITTWSKDDIPQQKADESVHDLKERLNDAVKVRISSTITKWDNETRCVTVEIENIFNFVFMCQKFLDEKGGELERCMQSGLINMALLSDIVHTQPPTEMTPEMRAELTELLKSRRKSRLLGSFVIGTTLTVLFGLLGLCVYFTVRSIKSIVGKYKCDPESYVRNLANEAVKHFKKKSSIEGVINDRFEPLVTYFAKDVVEVGEKRLKANRRLLASLTMISSTRKASVSSSIERYEELEKNVTTLLQKLVRYWNDKLRNYDYISLDAPDGTDHNWHKGLFGRFKIFPKKENGEIITVKSYTKQQDSLAKFNEELFMSHLSGKSEYVPTVWKTVKGDHGDPDLLINCQLVPARGYFAAQPERSLVKEHEFARHIALGIEYLHSKHLVHMEVSLDSILVDVNSGLPKLTNLGEARKVIIDDSTTSSMGHYVYLPNEVLNEQKYSFPADIYSFGLLLCEMYHHSIVFPHLRGCDKSIFLECHEGEKDAIVASLSPSNLPSDLCALVKSIVDSIAHKRPSIEDARLEISNKDCKHS